MRSNRYFRFALRSVLALALALLLISCNDKQQDVPGSVSLTVSVSNAMDSKTISPEGQVDISHYRIIVQNTDQNVSFESDYIPKGTVYSVSNVPAGEWIATAEAYVERSSGEYLQVATAVSTPKTVEPGSETTINVVIDADSLLDLPSGKVSINIQLPSALRGTVFYYQYKITGLTDTVFSLESGMLSASSSAEGQATIVLDPATNPLKQGAYVFEVTVQDTASDPEITGKGVDVMRLLPGLEVTGSIDLDSYNADQGFGIKVTDDIGNLLSPVIEGGTEVYTMDMENGNTLSVTLVEPLSATEVIEWYIDGTLSNSVDDSNAANGEYVFTFEPGSYNVTAIIRDTATAMSVGSISPFKVLLVDNTIFTFELNSDKASYTVTGLIKSQGEFEQPDPAKFEIPSTYRGLPVTRVDRYAFYRRTDITGALVIPESVTSIGEYAFSRCSGFNGTLTIGSNVETIGDYAFRNCSGFTGDLDAFRNCSGFTGDLVIPDSVTEIGYSAFEGCSGFTGELKIPDKVTSIGESAFQNCSGFTGELKIPESVTSISNRVFYGCSSFTGSLNISDKVTTIGDEAFRGCTSFNSLIIGSNVKTIGESVFRGCKGFIGSLNIPESVTSIGEYAFSGCSGFTGELNIPDSVTSIGGYTFAGCSGFDGSLTIGSKVKTIGKQAFSECFHLTGELKIPESVTLIGDAAFSSCSSFTGELKIPDGVESIGGSAFWNCTGFNGNLVLPDSVTSIGDAAFSGCKSFIGDLVIPDGVTSIGSSAFADCSGFDGTLTIGSNVKTIGSGAFYRCSGFKGNLNIPNNVTSIGSNAFYSCTGFDGELKISESVTSINPYTFQNCSKLTGSLVIPENVTSIGISAFDDCSSFTGDLVILDNVTTIGERAFQNCSVKSITVPWAEGSRPAGWDENWDWFYYGQIIYSEV